MRSSVSGRIGSGRSDDPLAGKMMMTQDASTAVSPSGAGVMGPVRQVLQDVWGYDSFRPLQEASIRSVLDRRDSLTVLPTGGGKSLCFQSPALCMDGMAVVVSPLISLMKDQVDALRACGVAAAFINSSLTQAEKQSVAEQIRAGKTKLLYVAPERLLSSRMLDFLHQTTISFFAIDEAHCISNWGHDFRPEYRGLRVLKEQFPAAAVHAYTATASQPVRDDIVNQLGLENAEVLVGDFDRPNLTYRMLRANGRLQQVVDVIERHRGESGIVYCISRKEVERTAAALNQLGTVALPYHAGMSDEDRKQSQDAFIKETCDVIVATVAFGMGIDKSNVRFVVHAGMPKSIEHYQQESGRAGRDGLESECVLIYSGGDVVTWKKIMQGDAQATAGGALQSLEAINQLCGSPVCRHKALVEYFGQPYPHENCGACDVCLDEIQLVDDPITLSQKILSCVLRVKERFGASHVAKVLVGSTEQRIVQLGHDKLSTHGLLADDGLDAVRMWIDQLVQQSYLQRTGEYQLVSLSESGRRLLHRDGNPRLSVPGKAKRSRSRAVSVDSWDGVDRGLFEALRSKRSAIASENNVPAYIVFGDATLRELARVRPTTLEAFGKIKGVGDRKLADFGETFLEPIRAYSETHQLEMDVKTVPAPLATAPRAVLPNANSISAFDHFRRGESIEEVAEKLGRAVSTVVGYLQDFLRQEKITDPSPWVDKSTRDSILANLPLVAEGRIKPMFEFFEGKVSYEAIRIVLTCHQNSETPAVSEAE
ncbi:DNA helicase RecQ [Novipirellula caenicola]|uniref:DNA helicase RecQ n=1 Tax=Novipirellula caenicola TaxID=1536901 RepID=A0ABP9VUP0_9BACT